MAEPEMHSCMRWGLAPRYFQMMAVHYGEFPECSMEKHLPYPVSASVAAQLRLDTWPTHQGPFDKAC